VDYHPRLPHIYPPGRWLFITWRLHGSLPQDVLKRRDDIAASIVDSLGRGVELGHYHLHSFVIMANHMHVLLLPLIPPARLLKSLKGATAREANRVLGRTGEHFWQRESFDHWVRDETEFSRIAAYIENNPVKAGLAACPEDYPWSSAHVADTP
jgi:REP element-mobilizing transposase RayT